MNSKLNITIFAIIISNFFIFLMVTDLIQSKSFKRIVSKFFSQSDEWLFQHIMFSKSEVIFFLFLIFF
jgi:hypothetical protein